MIQEMVDYHYQYILILILVLYLERVSFIYKTSWRQAKGLSSIYYFSMMYSFFLDLPPRATPIPLLSYCLAPLQFHATSSVHRIFSVMHGLSWW